VPRQVIDSSVTGRDNATVLEDVLGGLRQQQLFQLHLLHQLQRQIDQLVVTGALLGSRQAPQCSVAGSTLQDSGLSPGLPPTAVAYHVTQQSASLPTSTMTSHMSPMSAIISLSHKRLSEHGECTTTPSNDGL